MLARAGERYFLPIRNTEATRLFLFSEIDFAMNGDMDVSGVIGPQVDALLFIRDGTAMGQARPGS